MLTALGLYIILDGNHRYTVLKKRDFKEVPCTVVGLWSKEGKQLSQAELLILQQGFNFAGSHGHLKTTEVELLMSLKKLILDHPDLVVTALNNRPSLKVEEVSKMLLVKEEEKTAEGGQAADSSSLKDYQLKKLFTTLNHLDAHPKAMKIITDAFVKSESPLTWRGEWFRAEFWDYSEEVVALV